jgi:hypothetical protein
MIRRLAVTAAAALSAAALAVPASAAPLCMQITDETGDGALLALAPANRDTLDIVSADVATGKKNVVGALRLKSVASDPTLVGGVVYQVKWVADGTPYVFEYRVYATGEKEGTLNVGASPNLVVTPVDVVIDASTSTVTWTAPRKTVPALKKTGTKFTSLRATTAIGQSWKVASGSSKGSTGADLAETGKSYTDLTPTCLKGT